MTVRELDRLVSQTDLNPLSKKALRVVRKAVISGTCGDPEVQSGSWKISFDNQGKSVTMRFSFKRDT